MPDPEWLTPAQNRPLMQASGTDWVKGKTDGVNEPLNRTGHRRYRQVRSGLTDRTSPRMGSPP